MGDDSLSEESRVGKVMQTLDGSERVNGGVEAALGTTTISRKTRRESARIGKTRERR